MGLTLCPEKAKAQVMVFLPVMKELEAMGHNPVELMFGEKPAGVVEFEAIYVAIQKAKTKYPKWYAATTEHLVKLMAKLKTESEESNGQ